MKSRKQRQKPSRNSSMPVTSTAEAIASGKQKGAYEYAHKLFQHRIPIEIRGGDANTYVRLLRHESWLAGMSNAIASRFPCKEVTCRLDANRFVVVAEMHATKSNSASSSVMSWQDIFAEADRGGAEPTQKLIRSTTVADDVPVAPREVIMPPPVSGSSQPALAVQYPSAYSSYPPVYSSYAPGDFQAVRTSMPSPRKPATGGFASWLKVAAVFAAFIMVVTLIAITPTPFRATENFSVSSTAIEAGATQGIQSLRVATTLPEAPKVRSAAMPQSQEMIISEHETRSSSEADSAAVPPSQENTATAAAMQRVGKAKKTSVVPAAASVPALPSRDAVKYTMNRVAPRVAGCGTGQAERVVVRMTFSGRSGRVQSAQIINPIIHSKDTARCVSNAVRRAKLPKFQKPTLTIKYPFQM
ncbi:MAG: hypothetical protein JXX29_11595 [Deltaproteobacteria bacterium]|nr:hypothetical protein [Deltaproteobacteria bacterium]MBN2672316.1 hypothetical protein [Deltaproteobacteria bacterium]